MKSTTQEYSKPLLLNILNKQTPSLDKIDYAVWLGDVEKFLSNLPMEPIFDLIITSPPYNIGKPYEKKMIYKYI
ncbi:hypothetical protein [Rickettsia endosymbiont of Polydrusus tereticollis]|uniref:hypothetical protein n=1 Tax=Rickettsia endosymbiont of Polydrusus tereticollis TaxID=3066251 RepID=UPI003132B836|nr:hypothetical protein [Rickettsia endosymbiont of Oxypoda opaca]